MLSHIAIRDIVILYHIAYNVTFLNLMRYTGLYKQRTRQYY